MLWLVFTILLGIVFWGAVIFAVSAKAPIVSAEADAQAVRYGRRPASATYRLARGWGYGVAAVAAVAWVGLTLLCSMHMLGTGKVALIYDFSGKLTGTKDQAGMIFTAPWQHVRHESVQIQREEFELDHGNSAVSKDQQPIFARLVLNYQIDPAHVRDLYTRVGPNWKAKLVDSRVLQDFKEITATYPTTAMTAQREQLRTETRARLRQELSPYAIDVTDFFISNIAFSQSYTSAIEAKQVQVQAAARAQAKVAQITAEAEQQVAAARGEAQAISIRGRALRNNPEIIKLNAIEKLNPNVQVIYVPEGASLFVPQVGTPTGK